MAGFSFKNTPELISSINTLVARCEVQCGEALAYYGGMRAEVEQSVEESRRSIAANLAERQHKRDAGLEQMLAKCREYARYIKDLNDSARSSSKAYQKACAEAECLDIQQPQYSIETLVTAVKRSSTSCPSKQNDRMARSRTPEGSAA